MTLDELGALVEGLTDQAEVRELCWGYLLREFEQAFPGQVVQVKDFDEEFAKLWQETVIDKNGTAIDIAGVFVDQVSVIIENYEQQEVVEGSEVDEEGLGPFDFSDDDEVIEISGDSTETEVAENNQATESSEVISTSAAVVPAAPKVEVTIEQKATLPTEKLNLGGVVVDVPVVAASSNESVANSQVQVKFVRAQYVKWDEFLDFWNEASRTDEQEQEYNVLAYQKALLELLDPEFASFGKQFLEMKILRWMQAEKRAHPQRISKLISLLERASGRLTNEVYETFFDVYQPKAGYETYRKEWHDRCNQRLEEIADECLKEQSQTPEVSPKTAQADSGNGSGAPAQEPKIAVKEMFAMLKVIVADRSTSVAERMGKMKLLFKRKAVS